jgi:hypothetical protein
LARLPIERYVSELNFWEEIKIAGVPSLAAFSWCKYNQQSIIVLGGTDGNLL